MNNLGTTYRIGGVFMVENLNNGKMLIGSSFDVEKHRKQLRALLEAGEHPNTELQMDYSAHNRFRFNLLHVGIYPKYQDYTNERRKLYDLERRYVNQYRAMEKGYNKRIGRQKTEKAPDANASEAGE